MSDRSRHLVALLSLPWAALIFLGYFRTHPIATERSLALASGGARAMLGAQVSSALSATALDALAVGALVLVATLAGSEATHWLRPALSKPERAVTGFLVGSWLLGLLTILAADARVLDRGSVSLSLAALLVLTALAWVARRRLLTGQHSAQPQDETSWPASRPTPSPQVPRGDLSPGAATAPTEFEPTDSAADVPVAVPNHRDRMQIALFVLTALFVIAGWSLALLPPSGWDSLVYHLEAPRRFLATGEWPAGADGMHFAFPPLLSALYLDLMLLRGDGAAQLLHGSYLAAALVPVYSLAAERRGPRAGAIAALLLASTPTLLRLAAVAYVDLALLASFTMAFRLVTVAVRPGQKYPATPLLALAGLVMSVGAGVKYTGLVFGASLLVPLGLALWSSGRAWAWRRAAVAFTAAFAIGIAPWYLRNLLVNGNPIYPFVFGGPGWDTARAAWYGRAGTGLLDQPLALLLLPLAATFFGVEGGQGFSANVGPIWLALLPIGLLLRPVRWRDPIALTCGVLFVWWAAGAAISDTLEQTRLVAPAFGLLAVATACVLLNLLGLKLDRLPVGKALAVSSCAAIALLGVNAAQYWLIQAPLASAAGAESHSATLRRILPGYAEAIERLNAATLPTDRTLFLWEPRTYYAAAPATGDQTLDQWRRPPMTSDSGLALAQSLDRAGYTHLLVSRAGLDFLLRTGQDAIDPSIIDRLIEAQRADLEVVYGDPIAWDTMRRGLTPSELPYAILRVTPNRDQR